MPWLESSSRVQLQCTSNWLKLGLWRQRSADNGKPGCWCTLKPALGPSPATRPKPTLSNQLKSGGNVWVSCRLARKGPERQLYDQVNANSRPQGCKRPARQPLVATQVTVDFKLGWHLVYMCLKTYNCCSNLMVGGVKVETPSSRTRRYLSPMFWITSRMWATTTLDSDNCTCVPG